MIELTIDGKKVKTEEGSTVLRAALDNGIEIPHLCYDKRLTPYGGCRLCIVEIEGQRKPEASCVTLAAGGMVVMTETPRIKEIRRNVLEFMLVHHPLDCPVCDKAGECELQELAYRYGRPAGRFERERKHAPPDFRSPFVELDSNRCILCGKCVRLCAEHQGRSALGFIGRGFPTVVQPALGEPLECDYCGQCIDVCPTGALLSRPFKFKARQWTLEEKDTICPFCGCGCTLTLGIREGRIVRSRGREDRGVNEGNLCGRGRFGIDYIYSGNRLTSPMIRKDGELAPVSWDEALDYISCKLKNIINTSGPSSIGAIGSPRCTNEDNYALQKFMRKAIGSNNIDSAAAFGYGLAEKAWQRAFGTGNHGIDLKSPFGKDVIFVIESDLGITHPLFGSNILKAKSQGSRLIVADSRETKLTRHSTRWVRIKHGTGAALLNGIMKIMILADNKGASKIKGYPGLEEALREYTPEKISGITGLGREELIELTGTLVEARNRMFALSVCVSESSKSSDTVMAAANLINLLGESPDALQIPAESANTIGSYRAGIRPDHDAAHQTPGPAGKDIVEMLYEPYSLKALYIMGSDPLAAFPNSSRIAAALKSLNLLVVQDVELTGTAKLAHVILPAAGWAEKDGHYTNAEGINQRVCKAIEPPGRSLPDWLIINNLALTMGHDLDIRGIGYIEKEIDLLSGQRMKAGGQRLCFNPVHYTPVETPDGEYPLSMAVRDILQHAGSMSTRSKALGLVAPEALLEISGRDAEKYGVPDKGYVRVTSRRGEAYLKAVVSDDVPEGVIYVPAHFSHSGVSAVTCLPDDGGISMNAVRIEAV